jgi:hypothetical protein
MTRDDHEDTDPELAALALELRELDRDRDDDSLFSEAFMQEFTDFKTWDEFKVRLAATPRPERESFVSSTTRFASFPQSQDSCRFDR